VNSGDEAFLAGFSAELPGSTSRALLERAQRGDRESRERIWRLYGRLVWKIYLAKVPKQDRMDLCQEVFRTVFERLNEFHKTENSGPTFRAWLRRIAYNKVGNYISGERHRELSVTNSDFDAMTCVNDERPDDDEVPKTDELAELTRSAFEEASAGFQPRTVEAVRRLVFEGEPVYVVAAALKMSHSAVHIAKCRMLARVRAILNDLGENLGSNADPANGHAETSHGGETS